MAEYRLSEEAVRDLIAIADYTFETFGPDQARRYGQGLEELLDTLAAQPLLGVAVDWLLAGTRREAYQSHVVFYQPTDYGVFVVRVLHGRMDAREHLHEEIG